MTDSTYSRIDTAIVGGPFRLAPTVAADNLYRAAGIASRIEIQTRRGYRGVYSLDQKVLVVKAFVQGNPVFGPLATADLVPGDALSLAPSHDVTGTPEEEGLGYAVGLLVGDGHFTYDGQAQLSVWLDPADPRPAEAMMGIAEGAVRLLGARADFCGFRPVTRKSGGATVEYRLRSAAFTEVLRTLGLHKGNKVLTQEVAQGSGRFIRGVLQGLFDADGTIGGTQRKGVSVRLAQSNLEVLESAQLLLLTRLGVVGTIYRNRRPAQTRMLPGPDRKPKPYRVRAQHELVISRAPMRRFQQRVGFHHAAKRRRLSHALGCYQRRMNSESFVDKVIAVRRV